MLKENPDALKQKEPVSLKRPAEEDLVNEVPRECGRRNGEELRCEDPIRPAALTGVLTAEPEELRCEDPIRPAALTGVLTDWRSDDRADSLPCLSAFLSSR